MYCSQLSYSYLEDLQDVEMAIWTNLCALGEIT